MSKGLCLFQNIMSILSAIMEIVGMSSDKEVVAAVLTSWITQLGAVSDDLDADTQILRAISLEPEVSNNEEREDCVNELLASTQRLSTGYCYITKYVKAYVVFLQGKSSLPPVWEEGVLLFQHSSMLTKIVNYSTLGGDKVSTRWKLRELDLLSTYLGICKERGYLPNKEDCNMNSFKAAIRTESGKCWDLGAF